MLRAGARLLVPAAVGRAGERELREARIGDEPVGRRARRGQLGGARTAQGC